MRRGCSSRARETGIEVGAGVRGEDVVGGGIRIDSGDLQILNGATIVSHTSPIAKVPIQIHSDRVLVSGDGSSIKADSLGVSMTHDAPQIVTDISLEAGDLVVRDFGSIVLRSLSNQAGHLHIAADNISLSNGFLSAGSTYTTTGTGNIDVIARGALNMQNSVISVDGVNTTGGNITIAAGSAVSLDNSYIIASVHGFAEFGSGNVHIAADTISLSGHSSVAADGTGGNIELVARDALTMRDSEISTQVSGLGFGGNITVTAHSVINLNNSAITASVQGGAGNGGNISIDPDFVVLNHSRIAADAVGGNGGNVVIVAGNFLASSDSSVTASSVLGLRGNVVIRAPTRVLSGELAVLPETALDASTRFKSSCAAVGSRFSSFTVSGPLAASPGRGWMPSVYSGIGAGIGAVNEATTTTRSDFLLTDATRLQAQGCRF